MSRVSSVSGYTDYSRVQYNRLRRKYPKLSDSDYVTMINTSWNELTSDTQQKLTKESACKIAPKNFPAHVSFSSNIKALFAKKKWSIIKSKYPTASTSDLVKEIESMWKTLPSDEKQKYKEHKHQQKESKPDGFGCFKKLTFAKLIADNPTWTNAQVDDALFNMWTIGVVLPKEKKRYALMEKKILKK